MIAKLYVERPVEVSTLIENLQKSIAADAALLCRLRAAAHLEPSRCPGCAWRSAKAEEPMAK